MPGSAARARRPLRARRRPRAGGRRGRGQRGSSALEPLVREHLVPGAAAHLEDLEALGELLVGDVDRGDEAVARVLLHPVEVLEDAGLRGVWACGAQGRDDDVGGDPAQYREEVEVGTGGGALVPGLHLLRSEEHTSELQSLMRISYAVFCLQNTKKQTI